MTGLFDSDPFDGLFGGTAQAPVSVPLRILGFESMPTGHAQIREAFRSKVMAAHPDLATYMVPSLKEAAELLVAKEPDVQELKWARGVLLSKVKGPPPKERPKTTEQEAFDAAHKAAREAYDVEHPPQPQRYGSAGAATARVRRSRRPVTRGCASCGKAFEPGDELWRVRVHSWPPRVRRYCAECGPRTAPQRGWRNKGPGRWRSQCARCDRPIVLADNRLALWWCSCEEPDLMPVPLPNRPGELHDKCATCGCWPFEPANHWATYSCSTACTKALKRARTRDEPEPRSCEVCDTKFTPERSDARFCSDACRQFAYRQRQREAAS